LAQGLLGGTDSGQASANDNYIKTVHTNTLSIQSDILIKNIPDQEYHTRK
jgi:hypothetical protein